MSSGNNRPPNDVLIRYNYCKLSLIIIALDWMGRVLVDYIQYKRLANKA